MLEHCSHSQCKWHTALQSTETHYQVLKGGGGGGGGTCSVNNYALILQCA